MGNGAMVVEVFDFALRLVCGLPSYILRHVHPRRKHPPRLYCVLSVPPYSPFHVLVYKLFKPPFPATKPTISIHSFIIFIHILQCQLNPLLSLSKHVTILYMQSTQFPQTKLISASKNYRPPNHALFLHPPNHALFWCLMHRIHITSSYNHRIIIRTCRFSPHLL